MNAPTRKLAAILAFAHDNLDGVVRSEFQSLGVSKLKNISQKIEILAWGDAAPAPEKITRLSERSSVMVLPFSVSSGSADGELMAEGLTVRDDIDICETMPE